jgi:antirestriction protein ArdC
LLMQSFYHGLTQKSREQLDATTGGSFMSLTLGKAKTLMERIASNQGWLSCNIQSYNKSEEVLEEVCALSTKMDILLNWLKQRDNYKRDRQAIQDAINAQNRCGVYLGVFPES